MRQVAKQTYGDITPERGYGENDEDTTELIPELLRIPNSFSIIPACIFKNYHDTELRLSRIVPEPPPRICYLLKLRELHSQKKELIEQFEKEFKEYIRTVEDVISI